MGYGDALDFSGRTVLVVGGSSGIGNGIGQAFRECGATVHIWGTRASAEDYAGVEGSDLSGLGYSQVDVSDPAAVTAATIPFERLDVVVLSQGAVLYGRGEFQTEGFARVVEVNLTSLMTCAMCVQANLAHARGSLLIISSTGAFKAAKGNPAYAASKAGTLGLIRSLAEAWAKDGIRVNGIAPGLIETKMTAVSTKHPERLRRMLDDIPLDRLGQPADIAGAALFLASPLASYMIGQTLVVDGGSLLS
jgi:3-oxoacyl-[acyl-carrier protein] reductase